MNREPGGNFAPGELDRLLSEGEADIERGDLHDEDEVFRELGELSAALSQHIGDGGSTQRRSYPAPHQPLARRRGRYFTLLLCLFATGILAGRIRARAVNEARSQSLEGREWGYTMNDVRLIRPTLREAIATLRPLSGAEIQVDWDALEKGRIPCDTPLPIDLRLHEVTLDQVLPLVVRAVPAGASGKDANDEPNKHRVGYAACDGMVRVSTVEWVVNLPPVVRVYDVSQLLGAIRRDQDKWGAPLIEIFDGPASPPAYGPPKIVVKLITENVAPDSWVGAGGSVGTVACVDGRLVVLQVHENQRSIRILLDQLADDYKVPRK